MNLKESLYFYGLITLKMIIETNSEIIPRMIWRNTNSLKLNTGRY